MRTTDRSRACLGNDGGAVAVMTAVSLLTLLISTAVVVDVGQALVARNELQDVADAAALAGARELGVAYMAMTPAAQSSFVLTDPTPAQNAAIAMGAQNMVRGESVIINTSDIEIGQWNGTTRTLTVTNNQPNAVRVTTRRQPGTNGPISTFLASIMGVNAVSVTALATAALTGVSTTNPGDLQTPFGISSFRFQTPFCTAPIKFYPTNDPSSCGGWHTFTDSPPNANLLRNIIRGLTPNPPTYVSPGTQAGVTDLEFVGGNIANALNDLYNLYLSKRNPATGIWTALVPVYQGADCSNPNTALPIVGYATIDITNVLAPPAGQLVQGTIQCNLVDGGRGGGSPFGTLGSIPGLVQ